MNTEALDFVERIVKGMLPNTPAVQKSSSTIFDQARTETSNVGLGALSNMARLMSDPMVQTFHIDTKVLEAFMAGLLVYHASLEGKDGEFMKTINGFFEESTKLGMDKVIPLDFARKEKK